MSVAKRFLKKTIRQGGFLAPLTLKISMKKKMKYEPCIREAGVFLAWLMYAC